MSRSAAIGNSAVTPASGRGRVIPALAVTLRVARGQAAQQAALDAWIDARRAAADGRALAVVAEGAFFELSCPAGVALARPAPGCVCCVGAVPLRTTLTRIVRAHRPAELLLLIAAHEQLERVRRLLRDVTLGRPIRLLEDDETRPR
jgi:hypothetical protein